MLWIQILLIPTVLTNVTHPFPSQVTTGELPAVTAPSSHTSISKAPAANQHVPASKTSSAPLDATMVISSTAQNQNSSFVCQVCHNS